MFWRKSDKSNKSKISTNESKLISAEFINPLSFITKDNNIIKSESFIIPSLLISKDGTELILNFIATGL